MSGYHARIRHKMYPMGGLYTASTQSRRRKMDARRRAECRPARASARGVACPPDGSLFVNIPAITLYSLANSFKNFYGHVFTK